MARPPIGSRSPGRGSFRKGLATGKDAPKFTDEDLKIISSPLDFVGINVYVPIYVLASEQAPGWYEVPFAKGHAKTPIANFPIGPEVLYWAPKHVQSLWNAKEIFITENGCASEDVLAEGNQIYDTDRVMFMRAFLTQLQRATADCPSRSSRSSLSPAHQSRVDGRLRQSLRDRVRSTSRRKDPSRNSVRIGSVKRQDATLWSSWQTGRPGAWLIFM